MEARRGTRLRHLAIVPTSSDPDKHLIWPLAVTEAITSLDGDFWKYVAAPLFHFITDTSGFPCFQASDLSRSLGEMSDVP